MKTFRIDLSAPQETTTGKNLNHLLYLNPDLLSLIKIESACPHNGGAHSLCISGTEDDVKSWLSLFGERYQSSFPLVNVILKEMEVTTKCVIKAKDLKCLCIPIDDDPNIKQPNWFDGIFENYDFPITINLETSKEEAKKVQDLIAKTHKGWVEKFPDIRLNLYNFQIPKTDISKK